MITFWKGRVALYAILKALGVGPDDAVLMPGYTCMVVPSAAIFLGAQPVYADVESDTYNVTQATLEAAWRRHRGNRPKIVIIQHTYGIPVEAQPILDWARAEGLAVIEDCAHVLGSSYHGRPCGQLGDAAFFSSQWSKPVTTGLGGWAITGNADLAAKLHVIKSAFGEPNFWELSLLRLEVELHRLLFTPRLFWPLQSLYRFLGELNLVLPSSSSQEFEQVMPARYAMRMSKFQQGRLEKALALAQAQAVMTHRRQIARYYEKALTQAGFEVPRVPDNSAPVFLRYPVKVKEKERLLSAAQRKGIELGDWFLSPLHPLLDKWDKLRYFRGTCPVAEELCRTVVNLPTHPRVSPKNARTIIHFLVGN